MKSNDRWIHYWLKSCHSLLSIQAHHRHLSPFCLPQLDFNRLLHNSYLSIPPPAVVSLFFLHPFALPCQNHVSTSCRCCCVCACFDKELLMELKSGLSARGSSCKRAHQDCEYACSPTDTLTDRLVLLCSNPRTLTNAGRTQRNTHTHTHAGA